MYLILWTLFLTTLAWTPMALFRKNIWTLFVILALGGFCFLSLVAYLKWQSINEQYRMQQHNLVQLVANASHSLLVNQEMVLDILGQELLHAGDHSTDLESKQALNKVLNLNPDMIGVALTKPSGEFTFISTNTPLNKLPNLRTQESSKDSFQRALDSQKMVIGRTYFMPAVGEWLIPVRKAIRNSEGKVIAVVTAALRIQGNNKFFSDELHIGKHNSVTLVRDADHYVQFRSSDNTDFDRIYKRPMDDIYQTSIEYIQAKYNVTLEEIKASKEIYDLSIRYNGQVNQAVVQYDSRYELWMLSEIRHNYIVAEFLKVLAVYLVLFIGSQFVLYLLFKVIAEAEGKRRRELVYQATHDPLTQLPNRGYLQQNIEHWIKPGATAFSVFYIDMDHFKSVNDSFGHVFGDQVLSEVGRRLKAVAPDKAILVRQGGDEFIALNPCINDAHLMEQAQMIIDSLSRSYDVNGISFTLGTSIGIARYPDHGNDLDQLLRAADIAMYQAKKYKNRACLFAESMQEGYLQKVIIEQKLRQGLQDNELFMAYQPQVDIEGKLYGVEALVRWKNDELGFVPPDKFIPIAETSGLMPQLGLFIIRTSLVEIKALQDRLDFEFDVSLNISVQQFMQPDFLQILTEEIKAVGIAQNKVTLEITESLFIDDIDSIMRLLKSVRDMGMNVSMDDFGTGYSSLSMLSNLPIDELKIDKSFVDTILEDDAARKMIQNIIAIGKNYDMTILAEGVETEPQADMLRSFGCDRFQGYLYSRPLPLKELDAHISTHLFDEKLANSFADMQI